jgi:hypothetical protein
MLHRQRERQCHVTSESFFVGALLQALGKHALSQKTLKSVVYMAGHAVTQSRLEQLQRLTVD